MSSAPPDPVIFVGLPASGKSTYYFKNLAATHVHVSKDLLPRGARQETLIEKALAAGKSVVVDNTNVTAGARACYIAAAKAAGFRVLGYYFPADLQDALRRNSQRTGRALVPAKGVAGTYHRLQPPDLVEGFDALYLVRLTPDHQYVVTEWPGKGRPAS